MLVITVCFLLNIRFPPLWLTFSFTIVHNGAVATFASPPPFKNGSLRQKCDQKFHFAQKAGGLLIITEGAENVWLWQNVCQSAFQSSVFESRTKLEHLKSLHTSQVKASIQIKRAILWVDRNSSGLLLYSSSGLLLFIYIKPNKQWLGSKYELL